MPSKRKNEARKAKNKGRRKREKVKVKTAVSLLNPKSRNFHLVWLYFKNMMKENTDQDER